MSLCLVWAFDNTPIDDSLSVGRPVSGDLVL